MRRKDWWTQRLLEKLASPDNDWIEAGSKYAGRIYIAAMVIFMSLMFFFIHGEKLIGIIGVTVSIAVIIYNTIVGGRVVNAMKERSNQSFFGMREETYDHDEDDYRSLYMLRVVREQGFSSSELMEDTFLADDLEEAKEICLQRAELVLNVRHLGEWQEFDIGFEIQYDDIRVMLVTDTHFIPQPNVGDAIESSPARV